MKYAVCIVIGMYTPFCYGLEAAARQLREYTINMQEATEGSMEQRVYCQRSCVVPVVILIMLVAYILIHKSLHESGFLLEIE